MRQMGSFNRMAFCKLFFKNLSVRNCNQRRKTNNTGSAHLIERASFKRLPGAGSSSRSTQGRRMMGLRRSGVSMYSTQSATNARLHPI